MDNNQDQNNQTLQDQSVGMIPNMTATTTPTEPTVPTATPNMGATVPTQDQSPAMPETNAPSSVDTGSMSNPMQGADVGSVQVSTEPTSMGSPMPNTGMVQDTTEPMAPTASDIMGGDNQGIASEPAAPVVGSGDENQVS